METSSHTGDAQRTWNVLAVEDDALLRAFFSSGIQAGPALQLIDEASTAAAASALIKETLGPWDVLLVDLGLPDGSGLDLIRPAQNIRPECASLVISVFGDESTVLASIEAGAMGCIHKDSIPDDIAQSIFLICAQ
ncbi:MAG: response regulator [Limnohabitans sp.]